MIREAALISLQESNMKATEVKKSHLVEAMAKILPSIRKEVLESYQEFRATTTTTIKPTYVR